MLRIKSRKIITFIFCAVFFLSCFGFIGAQEVKKEQAPPKVYRTRQLGDKAFNDGLYELAAKFYATYQREAAGDPNAQIDAAECLIAANVHSGNALSASEVFNKLTSTFAARISQNETLRNRLSYWDGNIQMCGGDLKKASETFKRLLNTIPQNTVLYFQTLDALGTSQARSLHWDKAEKTYALLEFAGKKTKWQQLATRKRLLALLMSGNYTRARMVIKQLSQGKDLYIKIIENLILVKEKKLKEAIEAYRKIRKSAFGSDPLWYMLSTALAAAYMEKKDYENALLILNDSVLFANSEFDRQQALLSIINSAVAAGNIKAAVTTAEKFLKNYPESFISNEIRLRLANLYVDDKKTEDALQVYETVINDKNAELPVKLKSAKSAAHIFVSQKRYPEAKEKFAYLSKTAKDKKIQGEGEYWIAELLYIQSKYKAAADAFALVAKSFPDWQEKALFKQIKSLMNTASHSESTHKIQTFLKLHPKSEYVPDVSFLYALALKNDKKYHDAEKQFAKFAKTFPDHIYAPRALFEEGNLALDHGDDSNSVTAYTELLKRYPDHILVPNTLYRRMYVCFLNAAPEVALADAETLFVQFPKSNYSVHGGFRVMDHHVENKKYDKAIDILHRMFKKYSLDAKIAPRILYEIANTRFKEGRDKEALKVLDDLSEKFPKSDVVNDGLFLRGDIMSKSSEYEKAIPFFKKAAANRPKSLLETASWGRIGDSYFALGWKTPDGTNYLKATEFYNKVLNKKGIPTQYRDQALYKLGRCEEQLGDKGKALSKFHEAIYNYELGVEQDEVTAKSSKWFVKSALAAARLYLEKDTPEAAEAAIVLYKTLIKLGISPVEDYKKKIDEINNKYKLKD